MLIGVLAATLLCAHVRPCCIPKLRRGPDVERRKGRRRKAHGLIARVDRDFNSAIMNDVAHRPWPMPNRPWVMTQTWHELLFAHWAVDAMSLRSKVPAAF